MVHGRRCFLTSTAFTLVTALIVAGPLVHAESALPLSAVPYRIVYETFREGNWELYMVNADGSHPVNLTHTPTVNELDPHVSPDGTKVCFVVDEGKGKAGKRSVWYMDLDGTGRTKVADRARQPCWSPDSARIAYLKSEFDQFTALDYATTGLFFYDLETGRSTVHPNPELYHLYNICWSPDGKWFVATVHGGMGFKHTILAFEAHGTKVYDLHLHGCRPDFSPDGKKIAWGLSDWDLSIGDFDVSSGTPKVTHVHKVATSDKPLKIYHIDWSPDGRYIAFSRGPEKKTLGLAPEMVGIPAKGWNLCVGDATTLDRWRQITTDGHCDKEPDWAPLPSGGERR